MKKPILVISIFLIVFSISIYARSMDVNNNGVVDADDSGIIANNRQPEKDYNEIYDMNKDGSVDTLDIGVINSFRYKCPPFFKCDCSVVEGCDSDSDNDGVLNDMDKCLNTPQSEINSILREAEYYGCSPCEIDRDRDTIVDCQDDCPKEYGLSREGCPAGIPVMGDDLIIPYGEVVYSNQLKNPNKLGYINYINILILGKLDVAPVAPLTGLKLKAENNFIFYNNGIINAKGDINEPGKDVSLEAANLEIENTAIDVTNIDSTYTGPNLDLINKHILREPNDGGITKQCDPGQQLVKSCGYCGSRIKSCESVTAEKGIWQLSWSSCLGQGYCDPSVPVSDILLVDTHRTNICQNNKVEYAKTIESKECGSDCSYTNVQEINEPVAFECNVGYCGATCSTSANEKCGRCGTQTCNNCKESCSNEGVCTPGTKRVNTECSGGCEIREDVCGDKNSQLPCGWIVGTCKVPEAQDEDCNAESEVGTTKFYGYCGQKICKRRCADDGTGKAIYYWENIENKPEYTGADKCLPISLGGEQAQLIKEKETKRTKDPVTGKTMCEGKLVKSVDVYQQKECPAGDWQTDPKSCRLGGWMTEGEIYKNEQTKPQIPECGYECDNGQEIVSGSDTGECQVEKKKCENNNWIVTQNRIDSSPEICGDNKDNDCDGVLDNGCANIVDDRSTSKSEITTEKCSGCSCGNYNLDGDRNGKIDSDDFKVFYNLNGKCGLNPEESRADFNGDGCVGVLGTDKSFGGGYATVNGAYKYYDNPDFDCFMQIYKPNCGHGCADLDSDGTADTPDLVIALALLRKCQNTLADMDGNGCMYHIQKDNQIIGDIGCIAEHVAGIRSGIGPECQAPKLAGATQLECGRATISQHYKEQDVLQDEPCKSGIVAESGIIKQGALWNDEWVWVCRNENYDTKECRARIKHDGKCGPASTASFSCNNPPSSDLCDSSYGNTNAYWSNSKFNWVCKGSNSDNSVDCSTQIFNAIDANCGSASKQANPSAKCPTKPNTNLCDQYSQLSTGGIVDIGSYYLWRCDSTQCGARIMCTCDKK